MRRRRIGARLGACSWIGMGALAVAMWFGLGAAEARATVVHLTGPQQVEWTDEEKLKPVAARQLEDFGTNSHWMVRLSQSETPHKHDADLTVFAVRGQARLHIGDAVWPIHEGDVVRIPKGVEHWAELAPGDVCEVYAVYVGEPAAPNGISESALQAAVKKAIESTTPE